MDLHKFIVDVQGPEPIIVRDAGRTQIAQGSKTVLAYFAPANKALVKQHYPFMMLLKPL